MQATAQTMSMQDFQTMMQGDAKQELTALLQKLTKELKPVDIRTKFDDGGAFLNGFYWFRL